MVLHAKFNMCFFVFSGDEIVGINGADLKGMSHRDSMDLLTGQGDDVNLTIVKDSYRKKGQYH